MLLSTKKTQTSKKDKNSFVGKKKRMAGCLVTYEDEMRRIQCKSCFTRIYPKAEIIRCAFCASPTPLMFKGTDDIDYKVGTEDEQHWFVIMQKPCCQVAPLHQKSFYCSPECYVLNHPKEKPLPLSRHNLKVLNKWYDDHMNFSNIRQGWISFSRMLKEKCNINVDSISSK